MTPQWLHLWLARPRLNAARDRRQAMVRCIDRSDPGAWAEALQYVQFPVSEYSTYDLDRRLALRKAARLEPDPWKRGHIIRRINQEVVQ